MIPVDKGIPLPPIAPAGAPCKYPWKTMEIGDSFFYDKKPTAATSAAWKAGKAFARKFAARGEGSGARIWRVA